MGPSPLPLPCLRKAFSQSGGFIQGAQLVRPRPTIKWQPTCPRYFRTTTVKYEDLSNSSAYIALGSNVGDRIRNIEQACRELDSAGLTVERTSFLYETAPMFFTDQNSFINGVCKIHTGKDMSSIELLRRLKNIEQRMGREKTIEKGPRNIDLDILLHGNREFDSDTLTVPHIGMLEREFVLRPLNDLIPNASHPNLPGFTYYRRLARMVSEGTAANMPTVAQVSSRIPLLEPDEPGRRTRLMGILNLTPDSFSDGGVHSVDPSELLPTCQAMRAAGATILDIGGQSTRPEAPQVDPTEELSRILPTIRMLRALPEFNDVAISVDTYRASVASAAVAAGADCVNDVSSGTLDPSMLPTLARLGCSVVMMHMRGDPANMAIQTDYSAYGGIVPGVAAELAERVAAAMDAGVRRWRIILDPGLGFAKSAAQNCVLLQRLPELRATPGLRGFPWLVGASRKSFIGAVTGVTEARDRTWGTAAAVVAAVQGGADLVRVHDIPEMHQVAAMADAIWRPVERRADTSA